MVSIGLMLKRQTVQSLVTGTNGLNRHSIYTASHKVEMVSSNLSSFRSIRDLHHGIVLADTLGDLNQ